MKYAIFFEIAAVICNLIFVLLIIKQKKSGWYFGILGSALSIFVFVETKYYLEAMLYGFYVVAGFYGIYQWNLPQKNTITDINWQKHGVFIIGCTVLSLLLGEIFYRYTDASLPYIDAATTVFSLLATFLEAKKILSAWLYWIVLNAFSIWFYSQKDIYIYAALMIIYTLLSVVGYSSWRKAYKNNLPQPKPIG